MKETTIDIKELFRITGTVNEHQLSTFLKERGCSISSTTMYGWMLKAPESGILATLKAIGLAPDLAAMAKNAPSGKPYTPPMFRGGYKGAKRGRKSNKRKGRAG